VPKQKTRRAAAKRFTFTGSGKIRRKHAGKKHILEFKSAGKKRKMKKGAAVSPSDLDRVRKMIPGR
jgi:large subunit ribosomal protein L35